MKYEDIQPSIAALISGDAELGPLGTPIQVDPFQDPEEAKSVIADGLRATGVSIEVGFPWIGSPETDLGGSTHVEGLCEVFVAEHIQQAHTPNKIALIMRVIAAITKRTSGTQKPFRLRECESVKTEGGYVLHMLSFFVPLNLPNP